MVLLTSLVLHTGLSWPTGIILQEGQCDGNVFTLTELTNLLCSKTQKKKNSLERVAQLTEC